MTKPQTVGDQIRAKEGPQYRALKTCKGCCHFKSEYWREPSGDGETYDSGTSADCLKAGRSICSYFGDEPTPPDWCPCAALADAAATTTPAEQAGDVPQEPSAWRLETQAEHIARDMREGRFPRMSDPIQIAVNPAAALEPDPTPALGWRVMQTAAAARVQAQFLPCRTGGDLICDPVQGEASADAIIALPSPTDAQLLAEAMKLPEVQELAAIMKEVLRISDRATPLWNSAHAALAKIGGAA